MFGHHGLSVFSGVSSKGGWTSRLREHGVTPDSPTYYGKYLSTLQEG